MYRQGEGDPGLPGGKPFKAITVRIERNRFAYHGLATLYTGLDRGSGTVRRRLSFEGRITKSDRAALEWTTGRGSYPGNPGCGSRTFTAKLRCAQQRCLRYVRAPKPLKLRLDWEGAGQEGCVVRVDWFRTKGAGPIKFAVDFGGKGTRSGDRQSATMQYDRPGTYDIRVTATDRLGDRRTARRTVKMPALPPDPDYPSDPCTGEPTGPGYY